MFDFDFDNIAQLLLPGSLRQLKIIAWMKGFISQVKALKATFLIYREDSLFFLAHNSQVGSMEHFLNAKFNPDGTINDLNYEGNGIYISDHIGMSQVFLYNTSEGGPKTLIYNAWELQSTLIYNAEEMPERAGFIINIPEVWSINLNELSGWVDKLRLAGKNYTLKTY